MSQKEFQGENGGVNLILALVGELAGLTDFGCGDGRNPL
jgi:hypothetical protein